ncbi:MAG: zinc ribbon domain-containing protein, partial [Deltaproteobacteria bacterium]|nr:zinc ribbon domain-containing protein [Deltaproteobacteria bacterium]
MPLYEYECRQCKERFEVLHFSNDDESNLLCPRCQADKPQRILSLCRSAPGKSA